MLPSLHALPLPSVRAPQCFDDLVPTLPPHIHVLLLQTYIFQCGNTRETPAYPPRLKPHGVRRVTLLS